MFFIYRDKKHVKSSIHLYDINRKNTEYMYMFVLGFFSVSYDYCIYIVLVVCVNTGMVMSNGKMPAVKEKAYISHSQNHHETNLLVRC